MNGDTLVTSWNVEYSSLVPTGGNRLNELPDPPSPKGQRSSKGVSSNPAIWYHRHQTTLSDYSVCASLLARYRTPTFSTRARHCLLTFSTHALAAAHPPSPPGRALPSTHRFACAAAKKRLRERLDVYLSQLSTPQALLQDTSGTVSTHKIVDCLWPRAREMLDARLETLVDIRVLVALVENADQLQNVYFLRCWIRMVFSTL